MIIDYRGSTSFEQDVNITDIGNCCLKATSEDWSDYYLITKSVRGTTYCLEFGPIIPDLPTGINKEFKVEFSQMTFNEKKLNLKFFKFLNDYRKKIIEAKEEDAFNAYEDFPDIIKAFKAIE